MKARVPALEHAELDGPAPCERGQIDQPEERAGLGHVEVIPGQDAELATPLDEILQVLLDMREATLEDEGDRDVHVQRGREMGPQVREQGVIAALDQGPPVRWLGEEGRARVAGLLWHPVLPESLVRLTRVTCLRGYDVPDAASRVGDIPPVARDDMQMEMEDGLPRRFADVHPDVVAIGLPGAFDRNTRMVDRGKQLAALGVRGREPARNMAPWDEQRTAG